MLGILDGLTGSLHNSELVILAAHPSKGKTAFAMNIARQRNSLVGQISLPWQRGSKRFEDRAPERLHEFDQHNDFSENSPPQNFI